jgi:Helix-turn-helix of DDE superfamily endonuclease
MMLEYWREYRTYFHIAQTHGISESAAYRNIKWCENTLARSKTFRLPGRKAVGRLHRRRYRYHGVWVRATSPKTLAR